MQVSVRTRGGVFGLDRLVRVEDGAATVSERGETRRILLDPEQADRLRQLADDLVRSPEVLVGPAPDLVDGGWSEVDIVGADASRSIHVPAGAEAPDDLWELLGAVEALAEG